VQAGTDLLVGNEPDSLVGLHKPFEHTHELLELRGTEVDKAAHLSRRQSLLTERQHFECFFDRALGEKPSLPELEYRPTQLGYCKVLQGPFVKLLERLVEWIFLGKQLDDDTAILQTHLTDVGAQQLLQVLATVYQAGLDIVGSFVG